MLVAAEPHVLDVPVHCVLYLAAGVYVVHVSIEHHLEQHTGMERSCAAGLVCADELGQVKPVHYPAKEADWMILGNSFSKIGRKKNNFVGDVSFKLYLCHSLNSIPKITIFGGHNKARACESSGFNVLNSKMAQNGLLTQPHLVWGKTSDYSFSAMPRYLMASLIFGLK